METLLTRDQFRESVFARDGGKCVFCGAVAVDAHHIMERRLWPDGGYYIDNGVSVCEEHHLLLEETIISTEEAREAGGIKKIVLPPHLYRDQVYDKWGNVVLPNGQRLRGDLFFDPSVQKVLRSGNKIELFSPLVKYPRTYHLPWSGSIGDDDRVLFSTSAFDGKRVIVSLKMDGENTTLYRDHIHARSVNDTSHPSRSRVKQFWSTIRHDIPEDWRVCGENMAAKHSIYYDHLPAVFLGFSVWTDRNVCLSWDDTIEWFDILGITPVEVIYDGIYDEDAIRALWSGFDENKNEGYVIRTADEFHYSEFRSKVGKYVRQNHVRSDQHWRAGKAVVPNDISAG